MDSVKTVMLRYIVASFAQPHATPKTHSLLSNPCTFHACIREFPLFLLLHIKVAHNRPRGLQQQTTIEFTNTVAWTWIAKHSSRNSQSTKKGWICFHFHWLLCIQIGRFRKPISQILDGLLITSVTIRNTFLPEQENVEGECVIVVRIGGHGRKLMENHKIYIFTDIYCS